MPSGWRSCLWAIEEVRSFHWEPRRRSRVRVPYTPHLLLNKSIPLSRLNSDESYKKSSLVVSTLWSVRLGVRTQDFHSCNTGSIPVPTTNKFLCISLKQSGGAGVGQRPVKNSSLKIREGGFLVQVRITCEYISRESERNIPKSWTQNFKGSVHMKTISWASHGMARQCESDLRGL